MDNSFETRDNDREIVKEPYVVLVEPLDSAKVNEIFYNTNKPGQNLRLARETVSAAIFSGRIKPEDIKGRYFPNTTILLEDLFDPTKEYSERELDAIEEPLIKPLQSIFQAREADEFRNKIQPKDNPRSFAEYGADWLKQQLQPDLA